MNALKFMEIVQSGNIEAIKKIHNSGFDIRCLQDMASHVACCDGNLEVAKYLFENGLDARRMGDANFVAACKRGHLHIAEYLHNSHGCDLHALDNGGLFNACVNGHIEIVKWLIKHANYAKNLLFVCVRIAAKNKHYELADYLLADADWRNVFSYQHLLDAEENGDMEYGNYIRKHMFKQQL